MLQKYAFELLLAAFLPDALYGIQYSRQGDPHIAQSHCYCVLTRLPRAAVQILNTAYNTELFCGINLDLFLVVLAMEWQPGVDSRYEASIMEHRFLWCDWNTGRVVALTIRESCRSPSMVINYWRSGSYVSSRQWKNI